jgi:hypothetical protein
LGGNFLVNTLLRAACSQTSGTGGNQVGTEMSQLNRCCPTTDSKPQAVQAQHAEAEMAMLHLRQLGLQAGGLS